MKEDCELAVDILHIVLDNIAYENKDENGNIISDYQIYPFKENSCKQIVNRTVYKNHLFGLLLQLKLIKPRKNRGMNSVVISVVNDVQKWNSFLKDNSPYQFSIRLLREGGRHVFHSISNSVTLTPPQLDRDHCLFLRKCRSEFIDQITDYASYVSISPDEVEESSENESNEIERKRPGNELKASKTKTHHVSGASITVIAPPWYTIRTTKQDNRIKDEFSVSKRMLEEKEAEIETLCLKNEQYKVTNERLTLERKALIKEMKVFWKTFTKRKMIS